MSPLYTKTRLVTPLDERKTSLPFPPFREEGNFGPDEAEVLCLVEKCDHVVQDASHGVLEVIVERSQPSRIHVRVRKNNDLNEKKNGLWSNHN
ncbi:hypothetical protein AVEN_204937-1 [Araneus ventricosus]|uniref:Uncharacterized protein n=1 Tax=Araneus ventricosus TaxID=182803 RepID=A0A4Y2SXQ2_ARAVE|nr:hypothetical protein AVEN_271321-1 [Araneus ventricosus]GBN92066.1 hypothetical protein AVEN_204937-1 [Araneus ventricosus]